MKQHPSKKKPSKGRRATALTLPQKCLRSLLFTVGIGASALLICSLAAYFTADPASWTHPLGIGALALTALLGGVAAGRIHGKAPLTAGGINGLLLLLLTLLLSLFFREAPVAGSTVAPWLLRLSILPLSAAGALLGCRR